jgi:hypothetical protein
MFIKTVNVLVLKILQYTDRTLLQLRAIKHENKLNFESETASPLIPTIKKYALVQLRVISETGRQARAVFAVLRC